MKKYGKVLFAGLLSAMLLSQAATVMAAGHEKKRDHRGKKGKHHWCVRHADVELVDLDAKPRIFWHGQKIHRWYLQANLHSKRACYANIALRDEDGFVARERGYQLKPGRNRIELEPDHKFRFNKREHCFKAFIRLQNKGRWGKWEAARDREKFCAREKRAWTLDEGRRHHKRGKRR